ncbi:MAG: FAD:protein FMN transferase [Bavariicoccus seileri]|uniref:FAD:protein FMN transferase n=1 Tax=Bavariicoccus seileri TaxID=549685 RepID=A0A3D4S2Y1_9ENTE|nr:FAD:protein FMN transferase [Bavariicoccus seileri]HCS93169.1 FAD:protein FMN transferase [Bavariicoccus seileri]
MRYKLKTLLFIVITIVAMTGCDAKTNDTNSDSQTEPAEGLLKEPYSDEQYLLGTYVRIRVYDENKEDALEPAFERISDLGDRITINQKGSEIDEINANAGEKPVKVSDDIYHLLKVAYDYSVESNGGFNMAIGAITQLWRIGFDDARKPEQAEIDEALKHVDYRKVQFDDQNQTVYLEDKGMIIDLGAIAKGYIADVAVKVLKDQGVTSAIVDLGGNIFVVGHSWRGKNEDWNVGIQDPNSERGAILGSIKEADKTVVTSGIYERYLNVDGHKYHHIFDSKTGYPYENDLASVTVITAKSIDGDGLTTVAFDKGVKEGLEFIENETDPETQAIFVTKEGVVYVTDGITDTFKLDESSDYKMGDRNDLQ